MVAKQVGQAVTGQSRQQTRPPHGPSADAAAD